MMQQPSYRNCFIFKKQNIADANNPAHAKIIFICKIYCCIVHHFSRIKSTVLITCRLIPIHDVLLLLTLRGKPCHRSPCIGTVAHIRHRIALPENRLKPVLSKNIKNSDFYATVLSHLDRGSRLIKGFLLRL